MSILLRMTCSKSYFRYIPTRKSFGNLSICCFKIRTCRLHRPI